MAVTSQILATLIFFGAAPAPAQADSPGDYAVRVSQCVVMLIDEVEVPRSINSKGRSRGKIKELLIYHHG